jgi:dTDP-4-dehydrorhamnose 3,5-epimerase
LVDRVCAGAQRSGQLSAGHLGTIIMVVLAAGWVSDRLGLFTAFGGFVAGFAVRVPPALRAQLLEFNSVLLVPIFFALTGLQVHATLLTLSMLPALLGLLFAAVAGKWLAGTAAARIGGLSWRESSGVDALMTSRGLMILIFVTVGLQHGLLSEAALAMLVVVGLVTTALSLPVFRWCAGDAELAVLRVPRSSSVGNDRLEVLPMRELTIEGAWVHTPQVHRDHRGSLMEWFGGAEFADRTGRPFRLAQGNCVVTRRGAIRGIHYADVPPGQAKYVTCAAGAVLDVVVDLRTGSATFGRWEAVTLDEGERRAVYLAEGLGHALMALSREATVLYLCSTPYAPDREHGIHPLDPEIGIAWPPDVPPVLSERDASAPTLAEAGAAGLLPSYHGCRAYGERLGLP